MIQSPVALFDQTDSQTEARRDPEDLDDQLLVIDDDAGVTGTDDDQN